MLRSLLKDLVYFSRVRFGHAFLRSRSLDMLTEYQLMSLLSWHCHQTEKSTKHQSEGKGKGSRGLRHYESLKECLEAVDKKSELLTREGESIGWARKIQEIYEDWRNHPGSINTTAYQGKEIGQIDEGYSSPVKDLICNRKSVRLWHDREIPDEIIKGLRKCGMSSSTSCNRQGVLFVFIKRRFPRETKAEANNPAMLNNAPLIIYFCCDASLYPERFAPVLDVGMSAGDMLLYANSVGLEGCAMYHSESFNQKQLRSRLGIAKNMYVCLALLLGYPADAAAKPARMSAMMRCKKIEE